MNDWHHGGLEPILSWELREACQPRLAALAQPVRLVVGTARGCPGHHTRRLAQELAALGPMIRVEFLDSVADAAVLQRYGIAQTPAIAVFTDGVEITDTGIRFYGELTDAMVLALVDDLEALANGTPRPSAATRAWLRELNTSVHIHVFVRGNDPGDRATVALAHQFALASPFVWPDAIVVPADANVADPGHPRTLPCIAINGTNWLRGPLSEAALLRGLQEATGGRDVAGERRRATAARTA